MRLARFVACVVAGGRRRISVCYFFFQAEDGIRDLVRSRGLGDVYKRQGLGHSHVVQQLAAPLTRGHLGSHRDVGRGQVIRLSLIHI